MKGWSIALAVLVAALVASRVLVSVMLGLGDAEALYASYGRHLALSYLDHPPLCGWLLGLSTGLLGPSVAAVRIVPLVATLFTLVFVFLIARDLWDTEAGLRAAALLASSPVFSIGLTAATPDAPLAVLWTAFAWLFVRGLPDARRAAWPAFGRPLVIGALLGLAMLAKYTAFLLAAGAFVAVLGRRHRAWLGRTGFWLAAVVALSCLAPIVVWNASHGWAGLWHRLVWTQGGAGFSMRNVLALLGGQILYVGPFALILLALAAVRLARERRERPDRVILLFLSLPALGALYLLCLWSDVAEPHWPAAAYLPLFAAAGGVADRTSPILTRITRWSVAFGSGIFVLANVIVLTPLLPAAMPERLYDPRHDLSNELRGWPEVAETVRELDISRRPVVGAHYTICAQLAFALSGPGDPEVRCVSSEIDDFDLWHGPFVLPRGGAIFVTDNRFEHDPSAVFGRGIAARKLVTVEITRGGRWVRRFHLFEVRPEG